MRTALKIWISCFQIFFNLVNFQSFGYEPDEGTAYLPDHLSSPPVFSGIRVTRSLLYVYLLKIVACPFVLFLFAIVLSVLLRYTNYDYPFGIFKLFLFKKDVVRTDFDIYVLIKVIHE
jgi:hypothetical protein